MNSSEPHSLVASHPREPVSLLDIVMIDELQRLQDALAESNAVSSVITDSSGATITIPSKEIAVCAIMERTAAGRALCRANIERLSNRISEHRRIVCDVCKPLGFHNAVIPIFVNGAHLGNWWLRKQCSSPSLRDCLFLMAAQTGLSADRLLAATHAMPSCNAEQFERIAVYVNQLALQITKMGYRHYRLREDLDKRRRVGLEPRRREEQSEDDVGEPSAESMVNGEVLKQNGGTQDPDADEPAEKKTRLLDAINKVLQHALAVRKGQDLEDCFLKVSLELTRSDFGFIVEKRQWQWQVTAAAHVVRARVSLYPDPLGYGFDLDGVWRTLVDSGRALERSGCRDVPLGRLSRHAPALDTLMAVPLMKDECVVGFVALANKPGKYTPTDLENAGSLARVFMEALLGKRIEQDKHNSEKRLNLALESANEGLWDYWPFHERIYFSPSWFTMLGYRSGEFPSSMETWSVLTHPDDFQLLLDNLETTSKGGEQGFSVEIRMLGQGGVWRWIQARGRIVEVDARGNVTRVVGTSSDITKYKQVETALQKANEELHRLAVLDGLTQIANRLRFDDRLCQEWRRARREKTPISVILCDIDYFKDYNDFYGHLRGDGVLHTIAQTISATLKRPMDLIARYGGEEFSIILPNTNLPGAMRVANEVKAAIDFLEIEHKASKVGPFVTLSFGVAALIPNDQDAARTLVEAADQALYKAKKLGRNCIIKNTELFNGRPDC